jgi:hypothetical protein
MLNESLLAPVQRNSVLSVFPLARLSSTLMQSFRESENDRQTQNLFSIFQLYELRGIYGILKSQIPGMNFMLPVRLVEDAAQKGFVVGWIGDHDPYNLGDCIRVTAETRVTNYEQSFPVTNKRLDLHLGFPDVDGGWSGIDPAILRVIVRLVPAQIFDEAVKVFGKLMEPYPPCHCTYDYETASKPCGVCNSTRFAPFDVLFEKWKPHAWFEMVTGVEWAASADAEGVKP